MSEMYVQKSESLRIKNHVANETNKKNVALNCSILQQIYPSAVVKNEFNQSREYLCRKRPKTGSHSMFPVFEWNNFDCWFQS